MPVSNRRFIGHCILNDHIYLLPLTWDWHIPGESFYLDPETKSTEVELQPTWKDKMSGRSESLFLQDSEVLELCVTQHNLLKADIQHKSICHIHLCAVSLAWTTVINAHSLSLAFLCSSTCPRKVMGACHFFPTCLFPLCMSLQLHNLTKRYETNVIKHTHTQNVFTKTKLNTLKRCDISKPLT